MYIIYIALFSVHTYDLENDFFYWVSTVADVFTTVCYSKIDESEVETFLIHIDHSALVLGSNCEIAITIV